MRVLVTAASKHGATAEIAEVIATVLMERSVLVDLIPAEDVTDLAGYQAAVIGSAVYAGQWLTSATELVEDHKAVLTTLPVWLFSSGPVGDPPKPTEDPVDVLDMLQASGAREHRVFPGRLDESKLGFAERAMVTALRAPVGDFRDWDEIQAWAARIADELTVRNGAVR